MQYARTSFENLARRIALTGLTSRNNAEKLISSGSVRVDGTVCKLNFSIPDTATVFVKLEDGDHFIPPPASLPKMWGLGKPRGVYCDVDYKTKGRDDSRATRSQDKSGSGKDEEEQTVGLRELVERWKGRNLEQYGKSWTEETLPRHVVAINHLGLMDHGVVVLTTDSEFANKMRNPNSLILSSYRVKVNGGFLADKDPEKVFRAWAGSEGVKAHGIDYGKVFVRVLSRSREGTSILRVELVATRERNISDLLYSKLDLRVLRMNLDSFGPYSLGNIPSGQVASLPFKPALEPFLSPREVKDVLLPIEGKLVDPQSNRPVYTRFNSL